MSENDYVTPPKSDYVSPPPKRDYVTPPKSDYVSPPPKRDYVTPSKSDYVSPPPKGDYVTPPKSDYKTPRGNNGTEQFTSTNHKELEDAYDHTKYFGTPKAGLIFYISGYLILSLFSVFLNEYTSLFQKLVYLTYFLLSNYTYSWFAEYQRCKGGTFSWFFKPYGSVKTGWESSLYSNYQKGTVSKGLFGGYTFSSRPDYGAHFFHFIIMTVLIELLKFLIICPIALITIFTHKSTMRKYYALVAQYEN